MSQCTPCTRIIEKLKKSTINFTNQQEKNNLTHDSAIIVYFKKNCLKKTLKLKVIKCEANQCK
jgi:hypothetical protein